MRKLALLFCFFVCLFGIHVQHVSAQAVELAEVSGQQLLNRFPRDKFPIDKIENLDFGTDAAFPTAVMSGMGTDGHGAVITVFNNGAGYASKAVIVYNASDENGSYYGGGLAIGTMLSIGASVDEIKVLLNLKADPQNRGCASSAVWCKRANRRIVYEMCKDPQEDAIIAKILAYDK